MDTLLLKKKILINAVWGDCLLAVTHYDSLRYFITVPDNYNIGFVCFISGVLIGIVMVIHL